LKLKPWHGLALAICFVVVIALALLLPCAHAFAQEPAAPAAVSPHTRLMAARSIFIQPAPASIPYDVIGDAFQGWGRYQLADSPAAADLIVSIVAPSPNPSAGPGGGSKNRPAVSDQATQIRLLILDAHDRAVLWSSSEQPRPAVTAKSHEDKLVDASLRLFRRFRNTIEPEPEP
jgi:hypothetical protein